MQIVRWFLQSREYFGFMLKVSKSCKDVKKGKQFCINELFPLYFIGAYQNNHKLSHIVLKPISASFDGILQDSIIRNRKPIFCRPFASLHKVGDEAVNQNYHHNQRQDKGTVDAQPVGHFQPFSDVGLLPEVFPTPAQFAGTE